MTNLRKDSVGYRPFRTQALLAEGLLPVAREGGDLEREIAKGMFHAAGYFGEKADAEAARKGFLDGQKAALEGRTISRIDYDYGIDSTGGMDAAGQPIKASGPITDIIRQISAQEGVDPDTMLAIANIESGLNPNAKNPNSSAEGLFQQLDSNAKQYGVTNKRDAAQSTRGAAKFLKDNKAYLTQVLGRAPTPGELYLAHQQGGGGASKLLSNPNRRASDVVGIEEVRLNGGNASMTAGEFASLWTRKVKGKSVSTPPATSVPATNYAGQVNADGTISTVAKATVDPVQTGGIAASDADGTGVTLSGGAARPKGRDTVYGRAYDKAMIGNYVNMIETEVERTTAAVFRKYRDDPAQLAVAYDELRQGFLKDHVFPEIGGQFEAAFVRKTGAFIDTAYDEQETRAKQAKVADFNQATVDLETEQQQVLAGVDMKSPAAADIVLGQQASIDAHYDNAVANRLMSVDDAQKAKTVSKRKASYDFYTRQADTLDADGVKTMREAMQADFADGGIDGVDGDGWAAIAENLKASERKKRAETDQNRGDLRQRGDTMAKRIALGFDVNKDDMAKYMQDSATLPGGKDELTETQNKIDLGRAVRDLTLPEAQAKLDAMRKDLGQNPTDGQINALAFGTDVLETKKKALATDPISYGEQTGLFGDTGMLGDGDPSQVLGARLRAGAMIAKEYGIAPRYLKAGEAKQIGDFVRKNPEKGAALAASIVEAGGDKATAILAEFGDDAPVLAGAGVILASGGSPRAAEDAILGSNPDIKVKRTAGIVRQEFDDTVGNALAYQLQDQKRLMGTAGAIARKRIDESGVDPNGLEAAEIHTRAIHEAAGATFDQDLQYGGFTEFSRGSFWTGRKTQSVLVPATIRAERFDDVLASVRDDDIIEALRPQGGTARLAGLMPVAVRGGYAFMDDNGALLPDNGGRVFVLDIAAKKRVLSPRVPGAFK